MHYRPTESKPVDRSYSWLTASHFYVKYVTTTKSSCATGDEEKRLLLHSAVTTTLLYGRSYPSPVKTQSADALYFPLTLERLKTRFLIRSTGTKATRRISHQLLNKSSSS